MLSCPWLSEQPPPQHAMPGRPAQTPALPNGRANLAVCAEEIRFFVTVLATQKQFHNTNNAHKSNATWTKLSQELVHAST
eukprot:4413123-Lingulodinium_polyedra.AAC.1